MVKFLLNSIFLILCFYTCKGQYYKQGLNLLIGGNESNFCKFNGNQTKSIFSLDSTRYFLNGSSAISDTNGNLLLACDGFSIYDSNGRVIKNGKSLCPQAYIDFVGGLSLLTQSCLILPFPSRGIYYVLMPTSTDTNLNHWVQLNGQFPFDMILSSKVDITGDNGKPSVIKASEPILQNTYVSKTRAAACQHANGIDWWYLKQGHDSNIVYRFLVTADSIFGPYIQKFNEPLFGTFDVQGQSNFSADGTKYASLLSADFILKPSSSAQLFVADFDRCTGFLSNPKSYNVPRMPAYHPFYDSLYNGYGDNGGSGCVFSNNNKYLYIAKAANVFQLDLSKIDSSSGWYLIATMDTILQEFNLYTSMQMAPDGKIYIGRYHTVGDNWSTINEPDNYGAAAAFCKRCFVAPGKTISAPGMMPYFTTGKSPIPCVALGINDYQNNKLECVILENPTNQILKLKHSVAKKIVFNIYDIVGNVVKKVELNGSGSYSSLDVSSLASGNYIYKCIFDNNQSLNGKVFIK